MLLFCPALAVSTSPLYGFHVPQCKCIVKHIGPSQCWTSPSRHRKQRNCRRLDPKKHSSHQRQASTVRVAASPARDEGPPSIMARAY